MVVKLITRLRSQYKLRRHGAKLRRFIITRDTRNITLARKLAASQGIQVEHFDQWAQRAVQRFELGLELSNLKLIEEKQAVELPVKNGPLLFFHGLRLEYVHSGWGEYWEPKLTGCVKWSEGNMDMGMRVAFTDPFPTDSTLLERRDNFLRDLGYIVYQNS